MYYILRRPQNLKKSHNIFDITWDIFSNFCGLLRMSELQVAVFGDSEKRAEKETDNFLHKIWNNSPSWNALSRRKAGWPTTTLYTSEGGTVYKKYRLGK